MLRRYHGALLTITVLTTLTAALPRPLDSIVSSVKAWTKRQDDTSKAVPTALWILQDVYEGETFFDAWSFYSGPDPTNGLVDYVDRDTAFAEGLAYVTDNNEIIMKGDNITWLPYGGHRKSVRISSNKTYTGGLFLLDLTAAPWGCGTWPAYWSFAQGVTWPEGGEIDIIEGVHDNIHNQVAWHTPPGCLMTYPGNYTGTPKGQLDCDANINSNSGCGITDWSRVSYGETFTAQGGGVYAMKWDEEGIAVWYFYRASLPPDIVAGNPNPKSWTLPSAELSPHGCDIGKYFFNHAIIFDITFCGDWAGNSYSDQVGCPGTCQENMMNPANFMNASWNINNLKVYRRQVVNGTVTSGSRTIAGTHEWTSSILLLVVLIGCSLLVQ